MKHYAVLFGAVSTLALAVAANAQETTITIATVNNGDMVRMQGLADDFTEKNPDIKLEWVTLEENVLRQNVTTDIATGGGQYDVITIGTYEVPIWGAQDWLVPLDDLPAEYMVDDLLPPIRAGLSVDGTLYAVPFYGESSFLMYRTDLAEAAGVTIPEQPTWDDVKAAAAALHDPDNNVYGICLRGKAGWGENTAFLTTMANSYGARWFDESWQPQFDSPEWKAAITDYLDLMNNYGPPGASSNGFNENLTLFQQGSCGMWIDATVAGSFVTDPNNSVVAENVGLRSHPTRAGQARELALGLVAGHPVLLGRARRGQDLPRLGDRPEYAQLVAESEGHRQRASGHPHLALREPGVPRRGALRTDDHRVDQRGEPLLPHGGPGTLTPACSSWRSPSSRGLGTSVGQEFSAALAGEKTADEALAAAQEIATTTMTEAGYITQ
jgi:sorbitol/mannitol transport system substrate-binding protein